ncbi:MAG: preprotein translocase subunit SecE [Burkholderiales bacterium]|nr:preprotein translocase subunit SecE [Anaerolineae bacterium]
MAENTSTSSSIDEKRERRRRRRAQPEITDGAEGALLADDTADESRGITEGKGRATPGRRTRVDEEDEGNVVTRRVGGFVEYFEGVRSEIGKVVWPSREDTLRLTLIVLATVIASALVLGLISFTFTELFRIGLANGWVMSIVFAAIIAITVYLLRFRRESSSY